MNEAQIVAEAMRRVAAAAEPFESRWRLYSLAKVDADLHARFTRQQSDWDKALVTGSPEDVEAQTGAMERGYAHIFRVMEHAGYPDDAYMLGIDGRTGCRVAIGECVAARNRVRSLHGDKVVWLTPDEIARLWGALDAIGGLSAKAGHIKALFPGAEIVDLYPHEPGKSEDGPAVGAAPA